MFNKKSLLIIPFLALVLLLAGCGSQEEPVGTAQDDSAIIFFYGRECPHCKNVEKYFAENNVSEKIQFSQREVYHDQGNAALFQEKAKTCGISEDSLGVPLLWTAEKCYIGDVDIIDFFKEKL